MLCSDFESIKSESKMGCTNGKSVQIHNGSVVKKNESKETEDTNGLINSKNQTEKDSLKKNNQIHEKSFGNFSSN